jgi:hypothetical protein
VNIESPFTNHQNPASSLALQLPPEPNYFHPPRQDSLPKLCAKQITLPAKVNPPES